MHVAIINGVSLVVGRYLTMLQLRHILVRLLVYYADLGVFILDLGMAYLMPVREFFYCVTFKTRLYIESRVLK